VVTNLLLHETYCIDTRLFIFRVSIHSNQVVAKRFASGLTSGLCVNVKRKKIRFQLHCMLNVISKIV